MSRVVPNCISVLFAALAIASCSDEPRPVVATKHPTHKPIAAPVADGDLLASPVRFPFSGATVEPNITGDGGGGFLVSWIEKGTTGFIFAPYRGGSWFQPRMIAHGKLLVNKADFPSIAVAPQDTLYAQWVETKGGEATSIRVAQSTDNGATWSTPLRPHKDVAGEFGFASLLPLADRSAQLVWVDASSPDANALHAATIGADGKLSEPVVVDPRICDCCQTAVAMTDDGPIAAYRDRSADEIRDISIVRLTPNGWTAPKTLHADNWKIAACPVNGPQLDAKGKNVVAAWFTLGGGRPHVNVAFSSDSGATFGQPVVVDEGDPAGHVDVALVDDGAAIVTWVERAGDSTRIEARRVRADRTSGKPLVIAELKSQTSPGFPRLAVSKQNVAVVWNGGGTEPSVQMAMIESTKK